MRVPLKRRIRKREEEKICSGSKLFHCHRFIKALREAEEGSGKDAIRERALAFLQLPVSGFLGKRGRLPPPPP